MAPCTHPGMKRLFCLKAKNGLIMKSFFCPIGKKRPHYEEFFLPKGKKRPRSLRSLGPSLTKKKNDKNPPNSNTPRNPHPAGHRDQPRPTLETARDETRLTRQPILARLLHRSRVCGNQPRLYTCTPALLLLTGLYSFWCSMFSPAQLLLSLL